MSFKAVCNFSCEGPLIGFCKIAGKKRGHTERTVKVKYDVPLQLERGISDKDDARNFNIAKNSISTWKKNWEKIIAAFMRSGGTERQRINKGTYEDEDAACYNWLQIQR